MTEVRTAHTADLPAATLARARALLDDVFEGDFDDHDWDHSLGGIHALAYHGAELVGHAAVVLRRLTHGTRALRTGYVEGVGVRADLRHHGVGGALMAAVEAVVRGGYELGALATSEAGRPFYVARGWTVWSGPTYALTPSGVIRTAEEDGGIYVLNAPDSLDPSATLTCDWRNGSLW